MLAIAQSTIPLTKFVGRLFKSSHYRLVPNRQPTTPRLLPTEVSKTPIALTNQTSSIHPQQFERGPAKSGTSRPLIVQKFSPKKCKKESTTIVASPLESRLTV
jgi:hypothetical protein